MQTRHDFHGLEFDWFAVDAEGFVGVFLSAGWGPVPDFVFAHFDAQRVIKQHFHPPDDTRPTAHLPEGSPATELQSAFVVLPTICFSVAAVLQAADVPAFTDIDTRRA